WRSGEGGGVERKRVGTAGGGGPRPPGGRGRGAGCASEPCPNKNRLHPDTEEVPNLQRGHSRDCHQCNRPNIICARNPRRDRADENSTHRGNENENPEPLTERDPSNKANDDQ